MTKTEKEIFRLLSHMDGSCKMVDEIAVDHSRFYHAVMYCVNKKYRDSDFAKRAIICMKLRQKLSLAWAKQDLFGHLLNITGSYDDFHERLRDYSLNANSAEEAFLKEAMQIDIIHVNAQQKKVLWPTEFAFEDCIVLAWNHGKCIPIGFKFEKNQPEFQFVASPAFFKNYKD